jgi:SAM-dependent methyltransferase
VEPRSGLPRGNAEQHGLDLMRYQGKKMNRLTQEEFWDAGYKGQGTANDRPPTNNLKLRAKKLLGKKVVQYLKDYDDYLLWDVIYKRHLPRMAGAKVAEIGSAPGDYLVRLNRQFGVIPYGVEYTESGAELNRRVFSSNDLDPANVICEDFFSDTFQRRYKEYFDVVISRGFIEHFDDVGGVLERHLNLLKPRGHLVVSIPNFRGLYGLWLRLFRKHLLPLHNLTIMRKNEFAKLFRDQDISTLFCGYYGTFTVNLFRAGPASPLRLVIPLIRLSQRPLNVILHFLFAEKGRETSFWSPYLLFIGVKGAGPVTPFGPKGDLTAPARKGPPLETDRENLPSGRGV